MCSFQEKNVSSLFIWGNVLTLQTAYGNFLIFCKVGIEKKNLFLEKIRLRYDHKQVTRILWFKEQQKIYLFYEIKYKTLVFCIGM